MGGIAFGQFAAICALIEEEYGVEISEARQDAWFALVERYSYEQVSGALRQMLQAKVHGKPRIENLLAFLQPAEQEVGYLRALDAWGQALLWVEDPYGTHEFADGAVVEAVALMGGVEVVRKTRPDQVEWARKEFVRVYSALRLSGRVFDVVTVEGQIGVEGGTALFVHHGVPGEAVPALPRLPAPEPEPPKALTDDERKRLADIGIDLGKIGKPMP